MTTYVWMRDPPDSREPRIIWEHEDSPYLPPRDAVSRYVIFRDHNCALRQRQTRVY